MTLDAIFVRDLDTGAVSAAVPADWLVSVVLAIVAGILALLVAVVLISLEVRTSHQAIAFEVQRVLLLNCREGSVTGTPSEWTVH